MAATIDELTVTYVDNGVTLVEELDKKILSKGSWTTILFKYHDWSVAKNAFGPVKYSIRRYQKKGDQYQQRSKFNISSAKQARQLIDNLEAWLKDAPAGADDAPEDGE